jgi:hypothetical protein
MARIDRAAELADGQRLGLPGATALRRTSYDREER